MGQRFVEIDEQKIDEDTVLMDRVFRLNCPLVDMSPIAVEPDFTRKYLQSANYDALVKRIEKAFDRVAWEKDFVLCEGSGHAGVGSVFDLSNATVARILGAKAIIVTQGGIGRPIDEVALNQALFEKEGVEIIGVILNKVLPEKVEFVTESARRGLKRKGLELLGVLPHLPILARPTVDSIREELRAESLNGSQLGLRLVDDVVIGAMSVQNAMRFFSRECSSSRRVIARTSCRRRRPAGRRTRAWRGSCSREICGHQRRRWRRSAGCRFRCCWRRMIATRWLRRFTI